VNCYISLLKNNREKSRFLCNGTTDFHEIWQKFYKMGFQLHLQLKIILKVQDGGSLKHLVDPFCIIMTYRDFSIFKTAAIRHPGFFN